MAPKNQRQKGRDETRSTLDAIIRDLNRAKDTCGIPPARAAFGSTGDLLTAAGDSTDNEQEYVDLGLFCADVCNVLDRGLYGRRSDELSPSVLGAIEQLTATVADVQKRIVKQGRRNAVSQLLHAKKDQDMIAAWRREINRILRVFNTELAINTNVMVADIHRKALTGQGGNDGQHRPTQASVLQGELPPPPLGACFGRDDLVDEVVALAEDLKPIALIGAGGIGKTSVALTVLHHDRIRNRFGNNRRLIRCDQFPASRAQFLARLSKIIGAGIENPEDLAPLRPFLTSNEVFLILDNAESILDPQGAEAQEIHTVVDELCRFKTISVCITSRITIVPRHCKRPVVSTLSIEAARDIFYSIYGDGERSNTIDDLLQRLDFHALSITLLATTASHNMWDYDRLAEEWDAQRVRVLQTDTNESLAATLELSLSSPTFRTLGPDARDLLGVVAFFPSGVDKKNLDWLFPTIPDRRNVFDKFCVLSLTYQSSGFITMLAPIRDHLRPQDPKSSPLLCATKDHYFARVSVNFYPGSPGFEEGQWIKLEDVNVEHLLDVFIPIDTDTDHIWDACFYFMRHLYWHKSRRTILRTKIENLPEDHHSKPKCLAELSRLFESAGNFSEQKRVLSHALSLGRRWQGNDRLVSQILWWLSGVNRMLKLYGEGIEQAREALEIYERLNDTVRRADCLGTLAQLLCEDGRLDAAEEAASRSLDLLPEEGQEFLVCQSHRILGDIYRSKGEREKAIQRFEMALGIASAFNWHDELFCIHYSLTKLFLGGNEFNDAQTHVERAKVHAVGDEYSLGCAAEAQAVVWYRQGRLEDARSETLQAIEIFEKLGSAEKLRVYRKFLQMIEKTMVSGNRPAKGGPDSAVCAASPSDSMNTSRGAAAHRSRRASYP